MIKSFSYLLLVLSALVSLARATELTDLGSGLSYLRVHALADSAKGLTAAVRERDFIILDLRHATTTAETTELLRTAFATRAAKQPVLILVGPATPPAIAESLALFAGKCVILGVKDSIPTPQVIIEQSADADLRAYEAIESGQTLASLISGKIGKDRFDEAALMKEFNNGNTNATPPAPSDPTTKPTVAAQHPAPPTKAEAATAPAKTVEPLTDRVLQRAVHLHRALLALKTRSS